MTKPKRVVSGVVFEFEEFESGSELYSCLDREKGLYFVITKGPAGYHGRFNSFDPQDEVTIRRLERESLPFTEELAVTKDFADVERWVLKVASRYSRALSSTSA